MYVIMVYDVEIERVSKVLKIGRKYLNWVQNSVLEGELNPSQFERLKWEISRVINPSKDSVIFYALKTRKYFVRESIGRNKNKPEQIL